MRMSENSVEVGENYIIFRTIKSRRMRRAWHVARVEELRNAYKVLVGQAKKKRPL
jgi:hypothetical protein